MVSAVGQISLQITCRGQRKLTLQYPLPYGNRYHMNIIWHSDCVAIS